MKERIANTTEAMYGKEPDPRVVTELGDLLNYYAGAATLEKKRSWFVKYLEHIKSTDIDLMEFVDDGQFCVAGSLARIFMRGIQTEYVTSKLAEYVAKFIAEGTKNKKQFLAKKAARSDRQVLVDRKACMDALSEINLVIDGFLEKQCKSTFDMKSWATNNKIGKEAQEYIKTRLIPMRDELLSDHADLKEGYSHLSKKEKNAFIDLLDGIVKTETAEVKKQRKARKSKAKSPEKQVKRLQFQEKFADLGLQSIDPVLVIGATSLWVYNTKYRILTNYVSQTDAGFGVKGTTLTNVSDESKGKKVRKPETTVKEALIAAKVPLRKLLENLTTSYVSPNGRINKETILLRVVK